MTTVAVVSGFEPFKGSTFVAKAYYAALQRLGYEPRWYQCETGGFPPSQESRYQTVRGVSTGNRVLDQGLNFGHFYSHRVGRLPEDLVLLTDPLLLGVADANPGSLVIVHDLRELHFRTRSNLTSPILSFYLLSRIRKVRGVFAVSEGTRRDLLSRVPNPPPTKVVYSPSPITGSASEHIDRSLQGLSKGKTQQLLYVAVDRPYKRVRFIIDLARFIDSSSTDLNVRIVMASKLRRGTQRYLERDPPRCLRIVPEIEDISSLYRESDALLFPSEFEGFGLPLVEAMSLGLPMITSQADVVREVAGDAGISVPGYDVANWFRAVSDLRDPRTYGQWASKALSRASLFSEEAFRERLASVLAEWGL
jgi:glycosyltransferase involved in cell wall biosynthesis